MIGAGSSLVTQRRLEFHGLVRVLLHVVGARRCTAAGRTQVRSRTDRVNVVVIVTVVRMALEANLVLACNMRCRDVGCRTDALLHFVARWQRQKIGAAVGRLDAPGAAECARSQVGMP